ncbi:MAG: hypothetical protein Q8R70_07640, partial [Methanoregula sp.]|nr:hypothetical protein [Methanoregula sp.]
FLKFGSVELIIVLVEVPGERKTRGVWKSPSQGFLPHEGTDFRLSATLIIWEKYLVNPRYLYRIESPPSEEYYR